MGIFIFEELYLLRKCYQVTRNCVQVIGMPLSFCHHDCYQHFFLYQSQQKCLCWYIIEFIFLVINTYTLFCQKLLQSKNVMNKFRWFVSSMHCFNVFISSFDPVLFLAMFGHSILSHILIVTVSEKAKKVTNSRLPSQCGNCGNSHTFLENRESN